MFRSNFWKSEVVSAALAMVVVCISGAVTEAQTPFAAFTEDFSSPFDDDPVTWVGIDIFDYEGNAVTTQVTHTGDAIVLSNPAQINPSPENGYSLGAAYIFKNGLLMLDGDVRARATLQVSDVSAFGSIAFRAQDYSGDAGAYFANINGEGVMQMGDFLDPTSFQSLMTSLDPVHNRVVLEFGVNGNVLTASAWDASGPRPASPPTISFVDDVARPTGFMDLNVGCFGTDPSCGEATFFSYEVMRIPEPASCGLIILGIAGLAWMQSRQG